MYPLNEGMFAPRNQWYIAAWSSEVGREPMERWILNEPVAFYRKEDGTAVALEGRCPHRHFPLGKSRLVGDAIECGYHGMTFASDGKCIKVQTQATIPNACHIRSFPLVETWQWIWIWMGDPAQADPSLIPDHDELAFNDPDYVFEADIYYPVPGRYMLMHDNLLDLSHLGFLHQSTIASGGVCDVDEVRTEGPGWMQSDRRVEETDCPPFFNAFLGYEGNVDRTLALRFYLPCLHAGADTFYGAKSSSDRAGSKLGTLRVYHAVTPGTLTTAHYFFAFGRDFAQDNAEFGRDMVTGLRVTLEEDMLATKEIEGMLQMLGEIPKEALVRSDTHCVQGRRAMEKLIRNEAGAKIVVPA